MLGDIVEKKVAEPKVVEWDDRFLNLVLEKYKRPLSEEDKAPITPESWLRSSNVSNMCPRAYALSMIFDIPLNKEEDANTLWIYNVGTAYHWMIQNLILPNLGGVFQGWWKSYKSIGDGEVSFDLNNRIGVVHTHPAIMRFARGFKQKKGYIEYGCVQKPPGDDWVYCEMEGKIPELRLKGHWDGNLVWPDYEEVLELKSIIDFGFKNVDPNVGGVPIKEHVIQVHNYMMMAGVDRARIVYIGKGKQWLKTAFAEHVVYRDDDIVDGIKKLMKNMIKTIDIVYLYNKMFRKESGENAINLARNLVSKIPDRLQECTKKSQKRAKNCLVKNKCFERDMLGLICR